MSNWIRAAALALVLGLGTTARAGDLSVVEAWARATPPGAGVAAAYLTVDNSAGPADRLLGASCDAAERTEIHETRREGEVMKMRKAEPLAIAAGERVVFAPGGLHVMLMGLRRPLREGERLVLVLRFERAGEVHVEADVHAGH